MRRLLYFPKTTPRKLFGTGIVCSCSRPSLKVEGRNHRLSFKMSKLSRFGTALRFNYSARTIGENHGLSFVRRESWRRFSTVTDLPSLDSPPNSSPETPNSGLVFAKLFGINKHTLKTDIVNLLEGCNLMLDDVKVDYNRDFIPTSMMVQFPSREALDHAFGLIRKNGRLYRLERADRSQWDLLSPYDGKTVLMQGIPRTALPEDVERILSGCNYDASSINMFLRPAFPDPIRMATVRFPSQTEAMQAFLTKNRGFCHNNQILMRVLQ